MTEWTDEITTQHDIMDWQFCLLILSPVYGHPSLSQQMLVGRVEGQSLMSLTFKLSRRELWSLYIRETTLTLKSWDLHFSIQVIPGLKIVFSPISRDSSPLDSLNARVDKLCPLSFLWKSMGFRSDHFGLVINILVIGSPYGVTIAAANYGLEPDILKFWVKRNWNFGWILVIFG